MLILLFKAGKERYGLEVSRIREVSPMVAFQKEIGSADGITGLVNYRGAIVPVVDLSLILAGKPALMLVSTRIAFVDFFGEAQDVPNVLGLVLEHATETMPCRPEDFQPSPVDFSEKGEYCGDTLLDQQGIIQRIDLERLFSGSLKRALFPHPLEKR